MLLRGILLAFFAAAGVTATAQTKAERKTLDQLKTDITYLASDELEGRRTGTAGEQKAAEYIERRYQKMKIPPYNGAYYYPFQFVYGKEAGEETRINVNHVNLNVPNEAFPLPFSASKQVSETILQDILEQESVWLESLYNDADEAGNPHFDWEKKAFERSREAAKQGAKGIIFYDSYDSKYPPKFNKHSDYETVDIPVVFVTGSGYKKAISEVKKAQTGIYTDLNIHIVRPQRNGNNLAAYIDNKAKYTIVLGAHYDHLGYGEDHNSLHANAEKDHQIHHGADDNASGTAALLEMAQRIKKNKRLKHFNYLFVHFSGEELGLYGSKAFVKTQGLDSNKIACMINMDMVGRLNDSTHALTIGGVGTSPRWTEAVALAGPDFKLVIDSAGIGPSDHTSFYNAGIPVLFFFTGTHKDYHKPSDVEKFINYKGELMVLNYITRIVTSLDANGTKPTYLVTKQTTAGKTRFKVSLGIMPDYTFDAGGVRADGVTDNRPAAKAGLKAGDIITQLGPHKITGMQTYMEALGKFNPGEKTQITILRNGQQMVLPIELNK
jgi:hypothetical protein